MTPLDQFLKEVREKRESTGRCIWRFEKPQDGSVWEDGEYITFALTNQERFEKLVRVAVEKFQLIKEGARFTDPKTTNNNGIAMLSAMQIEQLASDALTQMNEIAGEK